MKLFNLTYKDEQFVSCLSPTYLPDKNFSFIEIVYSKNKIDEIKGTYIFENEKKECIFSDLNIEFLLIKLKDFIEREDVDLEKINLKFIENDVKDRILKIFIVLLSSYLIYFEFLDIPFQISVDLLNDKNIKNFLTFSGKNSIEKNWLNQISNLDRWFSSIFENNNEKDEKDEKDEKNKIDVEKEKEIEKATEKGIQKINDEVSLILKEAKEFKKRLLKDMQDIIKNKK